jgi:hypothetical protein
VDQSQGGMDAGSFEGDIGFGHGEVDQASHCPFGSWRSRTTIALPKVVTFRVCRPDDHCVECRILSQFSLGAVEKRRCRSWLVREDIIIVDFDFDWTLSIVMLFWKAIKIQIGVV